MPFNKLMRFGVEEFRSLEVEELRSLDEKAS
jgi:hypothetical protein